MDAESSHPKVARVWIPKKCIPQAPVAPKYVIKSTRIGEHTQFMRDHALIEKFLGLWPSEKDLARWIKTWWTPKGDYELQLSSKGFFTVIFYNLEDKDHIFKSRTILLQLSGSILVLLDTASAPKRKIFPMPWYGFISIPCLKSSG
jgi:hypothetical protein